MMRRMVFIVSLMLFGTSLMGQQQSSCGDCHLSALESPEPYHFNAWEHGKLQKFRMRDMAIEKMRELSLR